MHIVVAEIPNHPCVLKKNTKEMPTQMNLLGMFFENFIMEQHLLIELLNFAIWVVEANLHDE